MNVVITGALGHIGSSLIHNLPDDEKTLIDNFHTQRYCSLFDIPDSKFIQADITDANLESLFKTADVVIHLAAITDAENSFKNKDLVDKVNIEGTRRVAEACAKVGVPLIFPSTTSVYGVSEDEVDENCTDLKPQSPYAESKLISEKILSDIERLNYIIFRMGTIFGISQGMRFHTAVNKFCFLASIGQPVTVWRTAMNQNRPYLDIRDFVQAIKFVMKNKIYDRQIYNLVTVNTTVSDIIEIIKESIDVSVNYVDSKIMNQLSYTVSNKKFREFEFEFGGSMEAGIIETLELLRGVSKLKSA